MTQRVDVCERSIEQGRQRERTSPFPMIPVDEAIGHVLKQAAPLQPVMVKLADIPAGSILATDVTAPEALPPFPASIMDGYAVVAADREGVFEVVGRITAGVDPNSIEVSPGRCAYITTGAKIPRGADAVVKVEDTAAVDEVSSASSADEKYVRILKGVQAGQSIRPVGHDIVEGATVLKAGEIVSAAEVGLLATVGVSEVAIIPRPRVGIMSTGDELVEPGETISGGFIRDSNRSTLLAAVESMGGIPVDLGIIRDKQASLREAIETALKHCHVLVTSGGVSMGEADLLKPILESLGKVHFGRIRMKPGKPTTFATTGDEDSSHRRLVFGLPGNPVSSLVCSHLFVAPALRRLRGYALQGCMHAQVNARTTKSLRLDPVRPEYHRVVVSWNSIAGRFDAASTGSQMSSRLLSMKSANALLCVPRGDGELPAGHSLPALLIGNIPPPSPAGCFHENTIAIAKGEVPVSPPDKVSNGPTGYVSFSPFMAPDGAKGDEGKPTAVTNVGSDGSSGSKTGSGGRAHSHDHGRTAHSHSHSHDHGGTTQSHGAGKRRTRIKACLLTISDRASQGVYEDLSCPAMREFLESKDRSFDATVGQTLIVPDEPQDIQDAVKEWCDDESVDLVLTSGGTGFGRRDVTPESIRPLLHREAPGVVHAIYQGGLKYTPLAVLSRPVAGTRNNTLVITLPGSVKAVKENLGSVDPLLPRIINLLQGHPC